MVREVLGIVLRISIGLTYWKNGGNFFQLPRLWQFPNHHERKIVVTG
jgi:hypothetical protein